MHQLPDNTQRRVNKLFPTTCILCKREIFKPNEGKLCSLCKRTESNNQLATSTNLYRLQGKLYEVGNKRKFFEAYMYGFFAPAILFGTTTLSSTQFDFPQTQASMFQKSVILASTHRAFGVSEEQYKIFENQAKIFAKQLFIDFTHESALGFHMLSMHYWGSDPELSAHYRDITISICAKALKKPQNKIDRNKLLGLILVSLGLQDTDRGQPDILNQFIKIVQEAIEDPLDEIFNVTDSFVNFALFHGLLSNNLLGDKESNQTHCFTELEDEDYEKFTKTFKHVCAKIRNEKDSNTTLLLTQALDLFLMGLANYLKSPSEELHDFENAVAIFRENDYLIGFSGPRFIAIFDSAFKVAYMEKKYFLASQIVELQKKQSAFFPAAIPFANENLNMINTKSQEIFSFVEGVDSEDFSITEITDNSTELQIPETFVPAPTIENTNTEDPFGSSIHMFNLPVINQNTNWFP